jgi:hypothetical protein
VQVTVGGRPRVLALDQRAFLAVARGDVAPRELPVTVRYRDGATRVIRVEAGRLGR